MNSTFRLNKGLVILFHILFWVLLFALPFLLQQYVKKETHHSQQPGLAFYILKCIFWVSFFYFNAYVIIPRFYYNRHYGKLVLALIGAMVINLIAELIYFFTAHMMDVFSIKGFIGFQIFPFLSIFGGSTAYKMFLDRAEAERLSKEKETEHLKTELSFLRSQISPHFIFNVLNGMVALARKKSDQLEPSLIKLSSILRYMLYENDVEKVPLSKELEYLKGYIDLQQQRFGKNVMIQTAIEETDDSYFIEPMLLIPFVENAFKHGIGLIQDAAIMIVLKAEKGTLHFTVRNKYDPGNTEIKDKTSGIGLNNVERRLNLLYKNNYSLLITTSNGWFNVSLQLKLS